jgi:hypothetical protein
MNDTIFSAAVVAACLYGAVALGIWLRRIIPEPHLSGDSKDAVKLAMGVVATMSALVLGLLLSSAKSGFDAERSQVIQMAAKVAVLDRVLALYGPESEVARADFHAAIEDAVRRIWPSQRRTQAQLALDVQAGNAVYMAIEGLSPRNETQRDLKTEARGLAVELGQLRALLAAESVASISTPMLIVVGCWLVAIFLSFSLLAPPNATATLALIVSAFSVAGAFFLILELDDPFGGLLRISSEPMLSALSQFAK